MTSLIHSVNLSPAKSCAEANFQEQNQCWGAANLKVFQIFKSSYSFGALWYLCQSAHIAWGEGQSVFGWCLYFPWNCNQVSSSMLASLFESRIRSRRPGLGLDWPTSHTLCTQHTLAGVTLNPCQRRPLFYLINMLFCPILGTEPFTLWSLYL